MTREEAIYILYGIRADNLNLDDPYTKDKYDALNMAISALEHQKEENECMTCKYGEVYNEEWCRCQHPLIKGCRVKMDDGCEAKKVEEAQDEFHFRANRLTEPPVYIKGVDY